MIPVNKNAILVQQLCEHIQSLLEQTVLVGGCAVGFLITDPAQLLPRATDDVDFVAEILTLTDYYKFGEQLKDLSFSEDTETGMTCRWRKGALCLDLMPSDSTALGFSNSWYPLALKTAVTATLPNGIRFRHIDAPTFIATKVEAFLNRGGDDFAHHDIEDIITVINGRLELSAEVATSDEELRTYVEDWIGSFLETPTFTDMIPGHLRPNDNRTEIVIQRMRQITNQ